MQIFHLVAILQGTAWSLPVCSMLLILDMYPEAFSTRKYEGMDKQLYQLSLLMMLTMLIEKMLLNINRFEKLGF